MNDFDARARDWDNDKMHLERSAAIAVELEKKIPARKSLRALEYGAGTGILSFILKDRFSEIVLMDSSREMIKICEEKKEYFKTAHIHPLWFDMEHNDYDGNFDILYTQMVLHHVNNVELILGKFHSMLIPDGLIAIADIFPEDGSFHGPDAKVHYGFDPGILIETLIRKGFKDAGFKTCFVIKRPTGTEYPVFLLTAVRK